LKWWTREGSNSYPVLKTGKLLISKAARNAKNAASAVSKHKLAQNLAYTVYSAFHPKKSYCIISEQKAQAKIEMRKT